MYSLFIDTHSSLITIALINDKNIFLEEKESINSHSVYLIPMIKRLMEEHNLKYSELKEILVSNGPGSFTGIRIGLSVAKTLSYTLKIPIKTISSLTAYLISSDLDNKMSIIKDNKGYFVAYIKNNKIIEEYLTNIDNLQKKKNIVKNRLDLRKIYEYLKNKKEENVHGIKANYVKKIEVEK